MKRPTGISTPRHVEIQRDLHSGPPAACSAAPRPRAPHGEAPDTPKSVGLAQHVDIAALMRMVISCSAHNHVDDAGSGVELMVRMPEPVGEHAVFRHAVEDAVGPDDGGVHRAGKNQVPTSNHEAVKEQRTEPARRGTWKGRR